MELCIDQLDGISESAVIGVPDADFGERVIAVVVADADEPGEETIITALRPLLAAYKLPKQVALVDALPRNAMGKVQKNILRDRFTQKQ